MDANQHEFGKVKNKIGKNSLASTEWVCMIQFLIRVPSCGFAAKVLFVMAEISPTFQKTVYCSQMILIRLAARSQQLAAISFGSPTNCNDKVFKSMTVPKPITRSRAIIRLHVRRETHYEVSFSMDHALSVVKWLTALLPATGNTDCRSQSPGHD